MPPQNHKNKYNVSETGNTRKGLADETKAQLKLLYTYGGHVCLGNKLVSSRELRSPFTQEWIRRLQAI